MLAMFNQEPQAVTQCDNQYYYLYHVLMFFCALYIRMSYHYYRDVLYIFAGTMLIVSALVCHRWRWNSNLTWLYYYAIVLLQLMFDSLDLHLPGWFVLYPVVPMLLASIVENLMIVISADPDAPKLYEEIVMRRKRSATEMATYKPDPNRTLSDKWKMYFIDIYNDHELRYYYPIVFEVYMTACALFCIKGGGIMQMYCIADVYMIVLWVVFVYTEERKRSGRQKLFYLPNPVVKAVFMLYAPPVFWINISVLVLINIFMVHDWPLRDKMLYSGCLLLFTVCVNTIWRNDIFTACPFIEF